jgi:hypothetical protein
MKTNQYLLSFFVSHICKPFKGFLKCARLICRWTQDVQDDIESYMHIRILSHTWPFQETDNYQFHFSHDCSIRMESKVEKRISDIQSAALSRIADITNTSKVFLLLYIYFPPSDWCWYPIALCRQRFVQFIWQKISS